MNWPKETKGKCHKFLSPGTYRVEGKNGSSPNQKINSETDK